MATTNISTLFENNLRKVSEVGVAQLHAQLSTEGDRLGQSAEYVVGGDEYIVYTIPADSIVPKFYMIVDEAFAAGTTVTVSTIVDGTEIIAAATDVATVGATVSALVDTYFDATDGIKIVLNQASTVGTLRVVAEFISGSTNTGIYVDLGV